MMNEIKNLVEVLFDFLLMIAVVKVVWNFLRFGTPFSRKRMMYNMAKMNIQKNGGFKQGEKPTDYYTYKVWKTERRNAMLKVGFFTTIKGIKWAIVSVKGLKHSTVKKVNTISTIPYKTVDYSVFEMNDPDCLQYMD